MNLQMFGEDPVDPEPTDPKITDPVDPKINDPEPNKPEPNKPEPPKPDEPKDGITKEELQELQDKLDAALTYKTKYEEAQGYKDKYEATQQSLEGHEQTLAQIAKDKIEQIPEEFQELVPEGTVQEQLEWISKAETKGLFGKTDPKSIGSSSRLNDPESNKMKQEDMTPMQKLTSGIKEFYTK